MENPFKRRGFVDRPGWAARLDLDLRENVFPYWLRTAVDSVGGGYRVSDTHLTRRGALGGLRSRLGRAIRSAAPSGAPRAQEKHVVSQSRLLYVFSLAHRLGYGGGEEQYLNAARHGYRFLRDRMLDQEHGGVFWRVRSNGEVASAHKWLYAQAFAMYSLVEFHRASGQADALADALAIFSVVQERMKDRRHGGWIELLAPDFSTLPAGMSIRETGMHHVSGLKSANGHLHLMEGLSELLDVTGDPAVRGALEEVLRINTEVFFAEPGVSPSHVSADWEPVIAEPFANISYGHNLELAWLMLRAQQVLRSPPGLVLFESLLSHSLDHGFDMARGGFYQKGARGAATAFDTSKVWWLQAEGLAALSDALATPGTGDGARYERCLDLLLDWIWRHQRLDDGTWVWSTDATGKIQNPTKADDWKAGYHEVRAMTKYVGAIRSQR